MVAEVFWTFFGSYIPDLITGKPILNRLPHLSQSDKRSFVLFSLQVSLLSVISVILSFSLCRNQVSV